MSSPTSTASPTGVQEFPGAASRLFSGMILAVAIAIGAAAVAL